MNPLFFLALLKDRCSYTYQLRDNLVPRTLFQSQLSHKDVPGGVSLSTKTSDLPNDSNSVICSRLNFPDTSIPIQLQRDKECVEITASRSLAHGLLFQFKPNICSSRDRLTHLPPLTHWIIATLLFQVSDFLMFIDFICRS